MQDVRMITKGKALLVLDAGPSSLRFSLYDASIPTLALIARGQLAKFETTPHFTAADDQGTTLVDETIESAGGHFGHCEAFEHLARWLQTYYGARLTIIAVGHRITHGGAEFRDPALIDKEVLDYLEGLVCLEPFHQSHNLAGVRAVSRLQPDLPQIACFDTSFHRGRAAVTERFGVSDDFFQRGIRRWGFHGLAYESIAAQFSMIAPHLASGRVIVAHLGNEASLCGMKGGRCVDTTAGFSPLDGLPGARNCGSVDPNVVLHLLRSMRADDIETLLYERSGLFGVSGVSGDMQALLASGDTHAAAAVEFLVYRVTREIGSMAAALGGLDALIFTAGIGEHSAQIRGRICRGLSWLGIEVDVRANERREQCISPMGRSPSAWILPADSERIIAAHTAKLVSMVPARTVHREEGREDRAFIDRRRNIRNTNG